MTTNAYYIGKYRQAKATKRKRKIKKYLHCVTRDTYRMWYGVPHCPRNRCGKRLYLKIFRMMFATPF